MDLYPRLAQGLTRQVTDPRPRSIQQILDDARRDMEMEDIYWAWLRDKPLPQRVRHPRRKLRDWLFGRKPSPAAAVQLADTEPVWRN